MNIYYVNSRNEKIDFMSNNYSPLCTNLLDFEWDYTSKDDRIKSMYRKVKTKKLVVSIQSTEKEDYYQLLNNLVDIIDFDNHQNIKGKLVINDYYVNCNITASDKKDWEYANPTLENTLKILIEIPFWIKEELFSYYPTYDTQEGSKKYTYQYPYVYGSDGGRSIIRNNSVNDSEILLRMYGPISNPLVNVGGNTYQVLYTIEDGERIEIDTSSRKIMLIKIDGSKLDVFFSRNKDYNVFKTLKTGLSDVVWNNSFKFDVIVYEKRSEPKWR